MTITNFIYAVYDSVVSISIELTSRLKHSRELYNNGIEESYESLYILLLYVTELNTILKNFKNADPDDLSYGVRCLLPVKFKETIENSKVLSNEVYNYLEERNFKPLENEIL